MPEVRDSFCCQDRRGSQESRSSARDDVKPLLQLSRGIDWVNDRFGQVATWLVLIATLISAGNATSRYLFSASSNAWLEIQWYLFSAMFLLAAGYALQQNAHIRIDVLSSRLSPRARAWIEVAGTLLFLLPLCAVMLRFGWPMFAEAWHSQEMSSDPGGLIRWPVLALIPAGFALLALQGVSELIKQLAWLTGHHQTGAR